MTEVSQNITRKSASNLALAFILLPRPRREGMATLYAFCRQVDDVTDEDAHPVEQRRKELAAWREDIRAACDPQGTPRFAVNQELQPFIQQFHLPFDLFDELIKGCEMDLDIQRYEDYASLELYCYRVASVVGLLSIEVFGCQDPACKTYAVTLGKALQLTNILRDVRVDADRGRIYLPQEAMRRHGVTEEEVLTGVYSERYHKLASEMGERARQYYLQAQAALPPSERRAMVAAELMASVYWRLLQRLDHNKYNVFHPGVTRLSKAHKVLLIFRAWLGIQLGMGSPGYGR